MTKAGKPISKAQEDYIVTLIKERVDPNASLLRHIDFTLYPIPHVGREHNTQIRTAVGAATMAQASDMIAYLHTLPGKPKAVDSEASDAQRRAIWRLLKELGWSTYQVWTLGRDADIPHLDISTRETKVWDWAGELNKAQAMEVIDFMQAYQSGATSNASTGIAHHDDNEEIPF